jgi:hypothetical protein
MRDPPSSWRSTHRRRVLEDADVILRDLEIWSSFVANSRPNHVLVRKFGGQIQETV